MMSSINDVAKLYDEFEEAFIDVMTAKSEGLSFSRRMKLRLARSRLRAHYAPIKISRSGSTRPPCLEPMLGHGRF